MAKKLWLGMLAMVLAFGMTVVGCGNNNDPAPPPPTGPCGCNDPECIRLQDCGQQNCTGLPCFCAFV